MSICPCGCRDRRVDRPTGPGSRRCQSPSRSFAVASTRGFRPPRAGRSSATTRDTKRRCSRTSWVSGLSNCSTHGPLDDGSCLRTRINSLRSAETVASRSADAPRSRRHRATASPSPRSSARHRPFATTRIHEHVLWQISEIRTDSKAELDGSRADRWRVDDRRGRVVQGWPRRGASLPFRPEHHLRFHRGIRSSPGLRTGLVPLTNIVLAPAH